MGGVRDIVPTPFYLTSDDSAWLTGEQLIVSGGMR